MHTPTYRKQERKQDKIHRKTKNYKTLPRGGLTHKDLLQSRQPSCFFAKLSVVALVTHFLLPGGSTGMVEATEGVGLQAVTQANQLCFVLLMTVVAFI